MVLNLIGSLKKGGRGRAGHFHTSSFWVYGSSNFSLSKNKNWNKLWNCTIIWLKFGQNSLDITLWSGRDKKGCKFETERCCFNIIFACLNIIVTDRNFSSNRVHMHLAATKPQSQQQQQTWLAAQHLKHNHTVNLWLVILQYILIIRNIYTLLIYKRQKLMI